MAQDTGNGKNSIKYPTVKVYFKGSKNAFDWMRKCIEAARESGIPENEIKEFKEIAFYGNKSHCLCTCMEWFDVYD